MRDIGMRLLYKIMNVKISGQHVNDQKALFRN